MIDITPEDSVGPVYLVELTEEELLLREEADRQAKEQEVELTAREVAKDSAMAKLKKLGLTDEEIQAIIGL